MARVCFQLFSRIVSRRFNGLGTFFDFSRRALLYYRLRILLIHARCLCNNDRSYHLSASHVASQNRDRVMRLFAELTAGSRRYDISGGLVAANNQNYDMCDFVAVDSLDCDI